MREMAMVELAAKQEEDRRQAFMQQAIRRLKNRDLAVGFGAWAEFWQAKVYAIEKLRECANRLNPKVREMASAFYFWRESCSADSRAEELAQHEAPSFATRPHVRFDSRMDATG